MATDRIAAGELALQALEKLTSVAALGDFVYDVREREGKGWFGPDVKTWSAGCELADQAIEMAGIRIR